MTRCLISLGSNVPDRHERMAAARNWLCRQFSSVTFSDVYSTRAINGRSPDYLNMVAAIHTDLTVTDLTTLCKDYETTCGRTPNSKSSGLIEIDVDLLQYGTLMLRPDELLRPYLQQGLQSLSQALQ